MCADLFKAFQKEVADMLMPLGKLSGDFLEEQPTCCLPEVP